MHFRQLPYLIFHTKIFATNWSQIMVFSDDLIKYISSLKKCNTNYKKWSKKLKKYLEDVDDFFYPPDNKTPWWRRNDVSLYVPVTSQVRLKWNTQRRLNGTSSRCLSGTSPRSLIGTLGQGLNRTSQRRPISTSPGRLSQVSNETSNDVSVVRH